MGLLADRFVGWFGWSCPWAAVVVPWSLIFWAVVVFSRGGGTFWVLGPVVVLWW